MTWGLAAFVEVRRGEGLKTALMSAYFFLLLASYYVIKPVRNALFLEHLGPRQLPYAYLATAAVIGLVASLYTHLVQRVERHLLIIASTLVFVANLAAFWWWSHFEIGWVSGLFYLWAAIFSVASVTQFWSIANEIFNPEEAKRLFGAVGAGGILGGIVGGLASGFLAKRLGTENLLLVSAAVLLPCAAIVAAIHRLEERLAREASPARRAETPLAEERASLAAVLASPYLKLLSQMMVVMVIVATLVDYEFNAVAAEALRGTDAKTAFFGTFFASLSALSLVVQIFFTSPVLRRFGVGAALLLLPVSLGAASLSALLLPALWSVSALKLADGSLRYSLNQSTREILFLPVPLAHKYTAKAFIDMSLQRWSRGAAALIILAVLWLRAPWTALALLTLACCAVWVAVVRKTRAAYLLSLDRLLEEPERGMPELFEREGAAWPKLSPRGVAALSLAAGDTLLHRLLSAPEPAVRAAAMERLGEGTHRIELERLLEDADGAVRERAYVLACHRWGTTPAADTGWSGPEMGQPGLLYPDRCASAEKVRRLLERGRPEDRARAASLIAARHPAPDGLIEELARLLEDDSFAVRRAACGAAAHLLEPRLIPALIRNLASSTCGGAAAQALAAYGQAAVGPLSNALLQDTGRDTCTGGSDIHLAERACAVLSAIGGREAAAALAQALERTAVRPAALRALAAVVAGSGADDALPPERARRGYDEALRRSARLLVALGDWAAFAKRAAPAAQPDLVERALTRAQLAAFHETLLWQGLLAPGGSGTPRVIIPRAITGLSHWAKERQAASQELLESTLPREARRLTSIALSRSSAHEKANAAAALANVPRRHFLAWLPQLFADPDPGVRLAGAFAAATHPPNGYSPNGYSNELARLAEGGDTLERRVALAALESRQISPADLQGPA